MMSSIGLRHHTDGCLIGQRKMFGLRMAPRLNGEKENCTMNPPATPSLAQLPPQKQDKQLSAITLEGVLQKRQLDQALNAKEFAVLVGISYSTARDWFHTPGFPMFRGVVFWQDFAQWRTSQYQSKAGEHKQAERMTITGLPSRAAKILMEAR
jgi:hypothetical protein